ncbi:hypothetical protein NL676_036193 [Syzygium grande]|nr:hypothetical protein NL676_036193 [Syzygium grande]
MEQEDREIAAPEEEAEASDEEAAEDDDDGDDTPEEKESEDKEVNPNLFDKEEEINLAIRLSDKAALGLAVLALGGHAAKATAGFGGADGAKRAVSGVSLQEWTANGLAAS